MPSPSIDSDTLGSIYIGVASAYRVVASGMPSNPLSYQQRLHSRIPAAPRRKNYISRYFLREFNAGFTLPRSFASEPATS